MNLFRESGLQVEHALKYASLAQEIRSTLGLKRDRVAWSQAISALAVRVDELQACTPETHLAVEWAVMAAGLRVLACQATCLTIAQGGPGDLIAERARLDVLIGELRRLVSWQRVGSRNRADETGGSVFDVVCCDSDQICAFLAQLCLPTVYWHTREMENPYGSAVERQVVPNAPMLRAIIFLDDAPIATPQLVRSALLYPLVFRVRGLGWPEAASRLRIDLLTTCAPGEISMSEFILERPRRIEDEEYQGELVGHIKFNSEQSSMLDDLILSVRGAFHTSEGEVVEVPVIGHNELRVRVVNERSHPLMTGNRRLDQRIEVLVTQLIADCPRVHDELDDLLPMLQALSRLLATYAQEAVYLRRSDVREAEFQKLVVRDLRLVLGQDVQEHPSQAGGITDIRYRGVIVELKVERENGDREHISRKYTAQASQYAGVEARQVSVLLVLDLTSKDRPTSDIRNDIILRDVETHGGEEKEFRSKAFIFVVNGNTKQPSEYSR